MKVGIVITSLPLNGGVYHYSISLLRALREHDKSDTCYVVFHDYKDIPQYEFRGEKWSFHYLHPGKEKKYVKFARLLSVLGLSIFRVPAQGRFAALSERQLDLAICTSHTLAAWYCGIKYVSVIHDVWHRKGLPGASIFSDPLRDLTTKTAAQHAAVVVVDSQLGRREVIEAYNLLPERVKVCPTGPAPFMWEQQGTSNIDGDIFDSYRVSPKQYVFYPGGYQIAKNQKRVIEAVAILKTKYKLTIHALFCSPTNSYVGQLQTLAADLGVSELVHFNDMVPNKDVPKLYAGALALVMASYIGPTNMPIWEAFIACCPVISSNAGEMPDQVGDAGLLFDPNDATQLASCIYRIYSDKTAVEDFVAKGRKRAELVSPDRIAERVLDCIRSLSQEQL